MRAFPESNEERNTAIQDIAARWVVRHDRRLTPEEAAEFEAWRNADARHAAAFERSQASWRFFREIGGAISRAPQPVAALRSRWSWNVAGALAAAAVVALLAATLDRRPPQALPQTGDTRAVASNLIVVPETRRFDDGSVARLRPGAEIAGMFSSSERRVRLLRGEVFFTVAKDPERPFLVEVGSVTVRAVGTAFAIRFEPKLVDVLVTEGTVQVTPSASSAVAPGEAETPAAPALVGAGHRVSVGRGEQQTPSIVVTRVSAEEVERTLAWNRPMLDLAGATLGEVIPLFAQRLGRTIEIGDRTLEGVKIGGQFPIDDLEGFIRALEEIYNVKAERRADGALVLKARQPDRGQ